MKNPLAAPLPARRFARPLRALRRRRGGRICAGALGVALLALTSVLATWGGDGAALAQPGTASGVLVGFDTPSPTRGLTIPGGVLAGDADATSTSLNPGQLGFIEGSHAALLLNHWAEGIEQEGRGFGYLLAMPLLDSLSLGAGYEWLRPSAAGTDDYGKFTLGGGLKLGRALGFGMVWEHLFGGRWGGLDTATYGFGLRLHDMLAAAFVVRDAFRPDLDDGAGPELPLELDTELAIRPTGHARLELAGGIRWVRAADETHWMPHARFSARVLRGLDLFGDAEAGRTRFVNPDTLARNRNDLRFSVGLAISFDQLNLAAAGLGTYRREPAGNEAKGGDAGGFGLVVRTGPKRQHSLIPGRAVVRVKLDDLDSDRKFLPALMALRRLGEDRSVGAVVIEIEELDLGYGRLEELRRVLVDLGQRKPVFGWVSNPRTPEYYLASACHKVIMHPAGSLFLAGLAQTVTFWKGAMDKLGVNVDLVRIAEFKGAMEPFVMTQQSEPVRENRTALLDDLYQRLSSGIIAGRTGHGLDAGNFKAAIDKGLYSPAEAKDRGLVDEIADPHEMEKVLQKALGRKVSVRDANFRRFDTGRWQPRRVAVILVDGAITDGKPKGFSSAAGVAWADPIVDALAAVRRDSSVRAVVLRVNSPGGSAYASDRIARELKRLREVKKPVVVSMGDTAASGGYYVAAPADAIMASPAAITGSIGIFAYKIDVSGLAEKLGINSETTARGARSTLYSPWKKWDDTERLAVMGHLEQSYRHFLRVVAEGRKSRGLTEARTDQLGRGRIYTGAQAQKLGLVDQLGGFTDALTEAAHRGGIATGMADLPEIVVLPKPIIDPLDALLSLRGLVSVDANDDDDDADQKALAREGWNAKAGGAPAQSMLGNAGPAMLEVATTALLPQGKAIKRLVLPLLLGGPTGIEARMPYELEIR
jgi:protease IV